MERYFFRLGRTTRPIIYFLVIFILISILLKIQFIQYFKCSSCLTLINSSILINIMNISSNIEDEKTIVNDISILCLEMGFHFDNEQYLTQSPIISAPSYNSEKLYRFPYRYSQWKSISNFSRLLTQCEHNLIMHLLIIIDRLCRQHNITYFIIQGTLLGSLRHHDIIPWDDDVDIIISYKQRILFAKVFQQLNQTLLELYIYEHKDKTKDYYKLFYKNTPNAGKYEWHFPFIDIFFYTENQTHLWNLADLDTIVKIKYVFPLIIRPLGQLWMPTPKKSRKFFDFNPFNQCNTHYWDHRNEIGKKTFKINCNELKQFYPFVEFNNKTNTIETLKLNNTVIHTVIYK